MKKTLLALTALLIASTSNALIADKFKCSIEIKDLNSKSTSKQDKEFFIARLPYLQDYPPGDTDPNTGVSFTSGQTVERMTLDTPEATMGANLNFYYKHAFRNVGNSQEARQFLCVGLTGDYCKHTTGSPGGGIGFMCGQSMVACIEPSNPFDANNGWAETTIFFNTPAFNEQALAPVSRNITDDDGHMAGVVNLTCQYLGSFN